MSDKMRSEFEAWIDSLSFSEIDDIDEKTAWIAWQASRATLVVDLDVDRISDDGRWYLDQEQVQFALDATGVKYK